MYGRLDVETFLRNLGILAIHSKSSNRWVASCPNPAHRGNISKVEWEKWIFKHSAVPTWGIIDNPSYRDHGSHYCHACKFRGGPWELAAKIWNCSVEEAGKKVISLFAKPLTLDLPTVSIKTSPKFRNFELPAGVVIPGNGVNWFTPALEYLNSRGVTREQAERWGVGYAIRGRLRLRVVFPVYTNGVLMTYSARSIVPYLKRYDAGEERLGATPKKALFGGNLIDYSIDTITIAEGCFSTLALERAGAPNPCGMLGSYFTPERARIISKFKNIIIATDPDEAGDRAARWIAMSTRTLHVAQLRLDVSPDDADPGKLRVEVEKILDFFG